MNLRRLGIFVLCGALVNDVMLIADTSITAMAKIMFVFGLLAVVASGSKFRKPSSEDYAVFLYVAALIIISMLSHHGMLSPGWLAIAPSLMIGLVAHMVYSSVARGHLTEVADAYVVWVLISVFIGLVQAFTGSFYFTERIFESQLASGIYRASGLAADPNYFGLLCLIGMPIANLAGYKRMVTKRSIVALMIVGVIISGSRSAVFIMLAYFISDWLLRSEVRNLKKVIFAAFMTWVIILAYQLAPDSIKMVFDLASYTEDAQRNSLQDRAIVAYSAFEVGVENPFLGYGLGEFRSHPANIHQQVSHNTFLELFAESGGLGVGSFLLVLIYLFKRTFYFMEDASDKWSVIGLVFVLFFMSFFLVTHYSRILFFVTGVVAGAICRARKISRNNGRALAVR